MKYNLQIAGKTVKIEKAFRGEFGGAPSQFKVKGYDYFKTWSSGKPRDGFDQIIIDDVVRESINENVDEGQYRIYMNSDADDPKRINYEEYFESGTKDEMVRMAKKWIAEPDAKNMYGDPLLVSVTHEDYIDIVAWANEPVNEDIQPLAVEELTDEALLNMLKNIDDMNRDKKGGTYDMSGRKMTRAQYDLARSVDAEVSRRNLDLSYERTSGLDIDDSYEIGESVNEGFEWYQPLLALGGSVGLMATALFAVLGPSALIGGSFMGGDSWGDVFRHYKKKFSDKKAAKNLKKEDVQELINLIQTNIDTSDLKSGVKRYMKSLMNELENEMNKDEEEVDKNKLLVLLRNVENYAKRNQVNVNEAKTESELKDAWREWNKKHPKDQIDWGEYREEHGEHLDEVTQKEIDDIENSGNIDIAYKKALKLLNSLKDESVNVNGNDIMLSKVISFPNETGLGIPKPRYLNDMSYEELLGLRRRSDFPKYSKALKKDIKDLIDKKKPVNEDSAGRMELLKTGGYKDVKGKKHILKKGQMGKHERVGWDGDFIHFGSLIFSADVFDRDDLEVYESVNESVYGSVGFIPSDKDAKPEHPNWSDLSAEEIQDYIDANPDTLWGRSLSIAKMVLRDKKSGINEDIVDDKAKIYWLQKFTKGEIDTLPDNPRMEYLRHAMRDQLAQDKEQLSRERGEMSDEEEHEHVKNLLKRNFMDEELTSLTPNEIGDESKQNTSASGAYESKEFNFKSMIKEALKYKHLR